MHKKIAVWCTAALMCVPLASCGNKKNKNLSEAVSSTVSEISVTTENKGVETTAATEEKTTEKATEKPAETESPTTESVDTSSYTDSLSIAKDFYDAYLNHDPDTVYKMFNDEEIKLYYKLIKKGLNDKDPEDVFSKTAVLSAIDESMNSVDTIMDAYTDSENDKWSVDVNEKIIKKVTEDELKDFNKQLGTKYTSGIVIEYVDFCNSSNNESFTGNSGAFLEKDGKWYLSYSSMMQSDLLNYLEV